MAIFKICKLHFCAPLHVGDNTGDYGTSLKTVQSDTMYAALTSCLAKLGEAIDKEGYLGFSISSLFPFYQKDNQSKAICFLPKPLKQTLPKLQNLADAKKIKKVAWLDIDYASRWYSGEKLFEKQDEVGDIKGCFLTKDAGFDKDFMMSQVSERVSVSRTGNKDATPFYMDRVYFKGSSGLYFIYSEVEDTVLKNVLKKALKVLQEEGIGTDRNVGNGLFTYELGEIDVKLPEKSNTAMSLSVYIPKTEHELKQMLSGEDVSYDILRRGGWMTTPPYNTRRKNVVYAFAPASVFSCEVTGMEEKGAIVNLKPQGVDHPVYRSGKSLFIPVIV